MSGAIVSMEFGQLEDLLRPAMEHHLKDANADASSSIESMMGTLHRLLCDTVANNEGVSMAELGIQVPEVDAELVNMQSEVDTILQRLCECRKAVPAVVSDAMQQQLAELRPPSDLPPPPGDDGAEEAGAPQRDAQAAADAEQVAQLHAAMAAAFAKLPGLRARLEAAEERLSRNVAAVEGELRRSSPTTVERVMLNRTNLEGGAAEEQRGGGGSGADATKWRLARGLGA